MTSTNSATVRLSDVANVELGSASYDVKSTYNGQPSAGIRILLSTGANATDTAAQINAEVERLSASLPADMKIVTTYDTTPFIEASIESVLHTMIKTSRPRNISPLCINNQYQRELTQQRKEELGSIKKAHSKSTLFMERKYHFYANV